MEPSDHEIPLCKVLYFVRGTGGIKQMGTYSGRKINASFGNVTVRGEKIWKGQGGRKMAKSLSEHV
jgi:hypothetical protein